MFVVVRLEVAASMLLLDVGTLQNNMVFYAADARLLVHGAHTLPRIESYGQFSAIAEKFAPERERAGRMLRTAIVATRWRKIKNFSVRFGPKTFIAYAVAKVYFETDDKVFSEHYPLSWLLGQHTSNPACTHTLTHPTTHYAIVPTQ